MKKKFKIWDKKHKRWFHGHNDPSRPASTQSISLFGETILFGNMMVDQNTDKEISLDRLNDLVAIQYTGLKDKNDKEIYEGDIVHINYDKFGEGKHEVWSLEYGCYGDPFKLYAYNQLNSCREVFIGENTDNNMYFSEGEDEVRECTVIGNIYENPELLENNQ